MKTKTLIVILGCVILSNCCIGPVFAEPNSKRSQREKYQASLLDKLFSYRNIGGTGLSAGLIGGFTSVYDSNIYRYSAEEINEYDAYHDRKTQFNGVRSIDDWIHQPSLGLHLQKNFIHKRPTEFTFETDMNIYSRNTIKNYEQYRFELAQLITRNDRVKVGYNYIPEYFMQNLFDSDTRRYGRAFYSKQGFHAFYRHDFNRYLRFRFLYRLEERDFWSQFNERDNHENSFNFMLIFPKIFIPQLRAKAYYEFSRADAQGSDDDPQVDVDPSYQENTVGGEVEYVPFKRLHLISFLDYGYKTFRTGHSVDSDPLYSGREDQRTSVGARGEYDLTKNIRLFIQWEYLRNDAVLATSEPTTGDTLDYESYIGTLGTQFAF